LWRARRRGEAFAHDSQSISIASKFDAPIDGNALANASPLQQERAIAEAAKELARLRDTWLDNAHKKLDAVVFVTYGWPHDLSDEEILSKLLALNLERAAAQ
jgi:hypothetical protein